MTRKGRKSSGITVEVSADLDRLLRAMTLRQQGMAWRTALRKAAAQVRKAAVAGFIASGINHRRKMTKAFRVKVYRGGTGFAVCISFGRRFPSAYWRNRYGQDRPVVLWTDTGTTGRRRRASNPHRGHAYAPPRGAAPQPRRPKGAAGTYSTGSTPAVGFMAAARGRLPVILRQIDAYMTAAAARAVGRNIKRHYGIR